MGPSRRSVPSRAKQGTHVIRLNLCTSMRMCPLCPVLQAPHARMRGKQPPGMPCNREEKRKRAWPSIPAPRSASAQFHAPQARAPAPPAAPSAPPALAGSTAAASAAPAAAAAAASLGTAPAATSCARGHAGDCGCGGGTCVCRSWHSSRWYHQGISFGELTCWHAGEC